MERTLNLPLRLSWSAIPVVFMVAVALLLPTSRSQAANTSAAFDLIDLQVFAKRNIEASRSDFQGHTAAGGDITLSNFAVLGNLMAGGRVTFDRGSVSGGVAATSTSLTRVYEGEGRSVPALAFELASERLDQLSARMANRPTTADAAIYTRVENGAPVKHVDIAASRSLEVVELKADQLVSAWPGRTTVDLRGDETTRLIVRILGSNIRLQHVGFTLSGGIEPSDVVFLFPQASALEISDSGGAYDPSGRSVGIPGSVVAANASLRFGSALVTGQVFVRDILPVSGSPMGQVDRLVNVGDQPVRPGEGPFAPNRVLNQLDADLFSARCMTAEN